MSSAYLRRCLSLAVPLIVALMPSIALAGDLGVCATSAPQHGILNDMLQNFQTETATWGDTALAYARNVFFALVAIEMAWSAIAYILQKDSLPDFLVALLLKLLSMGFFLILLQPEYGPAWIGDIVSSFMQAGAAISGQPTFEPSDPSTIFNCGADLAGAMMGSLSHRGFTLNLLSVFEAFLTALLCSLGVMIGFAIAAGQLLITLIESYIIIGGGLFILGFSGSRWTLVFAEKYIGYVCSVGIKLFMLELIVGLGYGLGRQWAALFATDSVPPGTYIEVLGSALVFGFLAWQIPGLAASLMNGAPRMTLGSVLSTMGTMVVGGVVVGSGIVGMATGAATLIGQGVRAVREASSMGDRPTSGDLTRPALGPPPWDNVEGSGDDGGGPSGGGPGKKPWWGDDEPIDAEWTEESPEGSSGDSNDDTSDEEKPHVDSSPGVRSSANDSPGDSEDNAVAGSSDANRAGDSVGANTSTASGGTANVPQTDTTSTQGDRADSRSDTSGNGDGATASGRKRRSRARGTGATAETQSGGSSSDDPPLEMSPDSETDNGDGAQPPPREEKARSSRAWSASNFRMPPIPDDSADGSIHIRFKHPE